MLGALASWPGPPRPLRWVLRGSGEHQSCGHGDGARVGVAAAALWVEAWGAGRHLEKAARAGHAVQMPQGSCDGPAAPGSRTPVGAEAGAGARCCGAAGRGPGRGVGGVQPLRPSSGRGSAGASAHPGRWGASGRQSCRPPLWALRRPAGPPRLHLPGGLQGARAQQARRGLASAGPARGGTHPPG